MSIRNLEIANTHQDKATYTFKVLGERRAYNTADKQVQWTPFTATVTIDWERLAQFFCTGGRRTLGHKGLTFDTQLYQPKETTLD